MEHNQNLVVNIIVVVCCVHCIWIVCALWFPSISIRGTPPLRSYNCVWRGYFWNTWLLSSGYDPTSKSLVWRGNFRLATMQLERLEWLPTPLQSTAVSRLEWIETPKPPPSYQSSGPRSRETPTDPSTPLTPLLSIPPPPSQLHPLTPSLRRAADLDIKAKVSMQSLVMDWC